MKNIEIEIKLNIIYINTTIIIDSFLTKLLNSLLVKIHYRVTNETSSFAVSPEIILYMFDRLTRCSGFARI